MFDIKHNKSVSYQHFTFHNIFGKLLVEAQLTSFYNETTRIFLGKSNSNFKFIPSFIPCQNENGNTLYMQNTHSNLI